MFPGESGADASHLDEPISRFSPREQGGDIPPADPCAVIGARVDADSAAIGKPVRLHAIAANRTRMTAFGFARLRVEIPIHLLQVGMFRPRNVLRVELKNGFEFARIKEHTPACGTTFDEELPPADAQIYRLHPFMALRAETVAGPSVTRRSMR